MEQQTFTFLLFTIHIGEAIYKVDISLHSKNKVYNSEQMYGIILRIHNHKNIKIIMVIQDSLNMYPILIFHLSHHKKTDYQSSLYAVYYATKQVKGERLKIKAAHYSLLNSSFH